MYGCSEDKSKKYVYDGFTQGTTYHIAYHSVSGEIAPQKDIEDILKSFSKSCSLYDSSSLIVALNQNQTDSLDTIIEECIQYAQHFNTLSDGLFDITVKPLVKAYGFLDNKAPEEGINIDSLLEFVGQQKISIKDHKLVKENQKVEIDLNSIAQGYCVDLISKYLKEQGLTDFLVEIGGEIYASGNNQSKGWRVGIDKPIDGSYIAGENIQAIIPIANRGLTTSGNYRKFFTLSSGERINHTINPLTGKSSHNSMLSATVIASNAVLADGYTTTFMLMGLERSVEYLKKNPELDALLIYSENDKIKSYTTPNLAKIIEKPLN